MNAAEREQLAWRAVRALQRELPPEISGPAADIPVVMLPRPTRAMVRDDGLEPDLLGLFVGPSRTDEIDSADPLPPEILLFLDNIWEVAEGNPDAFREEVRVTYYHELGHYLGLEEEDLEDRGLE